MPRKAGLLGGGAPSAARGVEVGGGRPRPRGGCATNYNALVDENVPSRPQRLVPAVRHGDRIL